MVEISGGVSIGRCFVEWFSQFHAARRQFLNSSPCLPCLHRPPQAELRTSAELQHQREQMRRAQLAASDAAFAAAQVAGAGDRDHDEWSDEQRVPLRPASATPKRGMRPNQA